jgi:hypothetical protein
MADNRLKTNEINNYGITLNQIITQMTIKKSDRRGMQKFQLKCAFQLAKLVPISKDLSRVILLGQQLCL